MQILPLFVPTNNINKIFNNLTSTPKDLFLIFPNSQTQTIIFNFLKEYKDSAETLKVYIKELERLLLWCNHVAAIEILHLQREHIVKYQHFLKQPTPKKLWCGDKVPKLLKTGIVNSKWRVFYKDLGDNSIKKILKIIDSFFNYLVQCHYLTGNPLAINRRRNKNNPQPKIVDRYLELDEINAVLNALATCTEQKNQKFLAIRAKYIILLLFYTGMRISEAAKHNMGHFIQREDNWFLAVIGKGKKYRSIPIPDELLDSLSNFRVSIGLPYLPQFKEDTPIIPSANLKSHLTTRRIDQILKWAFNLGAKTFSINNPRKSSKLNLASAHWLRHSYVTYLLNSGASLKVAQENAGHSDVGTTMLYRHVNQADRHEATRHLSLKENKIIEK